MLDVEAGGSYWPVPGLLSAELLVLEVSSLLANEAIVRDCDLINSANSLICVCTDKIFLFPLSVRPLLLVAPLPCRLPLPRPPPRPLSWPCLDPWLPLFISFSRQDWRSYFWSLLRRPNESRLCYRSSTPVRPVFVVKVDTLWEPVSWFFWKCTIMIRKSLASSKSVSLA